MFAIHFVGWVVVVGGGEHENISRWWVLIINNFVIQIWGRVWVDNLCCRRKSNRAWIWVLFAMCVGVGQVLPCLNGNLLCTCGNSSARRKGTCLVRSSAKMMMMITISKQRLPDIRKRGKTFINHEHLLNRSRLLFCASTRLQSQSMAIV